MKKYFSLLLFLICIMVLPVHASNYDVQTLIPIDTEASVSTDTITYQNFIYHSASDDKGNCTLSFSSISNNTDNKIPVTIDLLLFDANKKNIGYVTYCSERDIDSEYSGKLLQPHEAINYNITVSKRYLAGDNKPTDTRFVAVMDENPYCHVGGYKNYEGLTMEEIITGTQANHKTHAEIFDELFAFLKDNGIVYYAVLIVLGILALLISGSIINFFHRKIYGKPTSLAYLPALDLFVIVKMAFGSIIGAIYLGLVLLSLFLVYMSHWTLFIILAVIAGISLVIVIIKVVFKKYDLFLLEPKMNTLPVNIGGDFHDLRSYNGGEEQNFSANNDSSQEKKPHKGLFSMFQKPENPVMNQSQDTFVDLSYGSDFSNQSLDDSQTQTEEKVSLGSDSLSDSLYDDINRNDPENDNSNDNQNNEGESDIFKFFN